MEPALDERGDLGMLRTWIRAPNGPQWSPLSTSGATRVVAGEVGAVGAAAMEPALDERGDLRKKLDRML